LLTWRILAGAGLLLGPAIGIVNAVFTAEGLLSLGLSTLQWQLVGGIIFFAGGIGILHTQQNEIVALRKRVSAVEDAKIATAIELIFEADETEFAKNLCAFVFSIHNTGTAAAGNVRPYLQSVAPGAGRGITLPFKLRVLGEGETEINPDDDLEVALFEAHMTEPDEGEPTAYLQFQTQNQMRFWVDIEPGVEYLIEVRVTARNALPATLRVGLCQPSVRGEIKVWPQAS